eukprot:6492656-Amphidinium_carterae.5
MSTRYHYTLHITLIREDVTSCEQCLGPGKHKTCVVHGSHPLDASHCLHTNVLLVFSDCAQQ